MCFVPCHDRVSGQYSPARMWIFDGNISKFGDAGGGLGERCLFFLTMWHPENRLPGARALCG